MSCFRTVSNKCLPFIKSGIVKPSQFRTQLQPYSSTARQLNQNRLIQSLSQICGGFVVCGLSAYLFKNRPSLADKLSVKALDEDKPRTWHINFLADVVEKAQPALVFIEVHLRHPYYNSMEKSAGSGFIVRDDGLILTNAHVVSRQAEVHVKLQDGRVVTGQVQAVDPVTDLATVKINEKNLPVLKLGKSSESRPGEFVIAMGSPLTLSNSVTHGIISSVHRGSEELGMHNRDMAYIQTDAVITKGNSGGPLVNMNGEVIGINTLNVISGISFAIPSDRASEFLKKAEELEKRSAKKGTSWFGMGTKERKMKFMGITMFTLSPENLSEFQSRVPNFPRAITSGVLIPSVNYGSPAHRAGLQPGDIIVKINGQDIASSNDVTEALKTNNSLAIEVYRQNKKFMFTVIPEVID